ncbi:hypothetical protein FQR65_LT19282 [Abscondita terminalis]|nr:hypothetical protein FQR65_LT19282 [Abscondita terminalis]
MSSSESEITAIIENNQERKGKKGIINRSNYKSEKIKNAKLKRTAVKIELLVNMEKRERNGNYTEADKELLSTIAIKYFHIIENKKTDALTIKQKHEAWENIAVDYNSSTINLKRTALQLKNAYNNFKKKLKKESAEDKIQIYKTGGGTAPPKNITDEKSRLLSLLQPQMQPIQNSFDSSANYIIEDDLITADVEIVPDVNDVSISNSVPCQNDNQPSGVKRKKISDVYESISTYTQKKIQKTCSADQKLKLEIEMLEIKKQKEKELLEQETLRRRILEIDLLIKQKQLEALN